MSTENDQNNNENFQPPENVQPQTVPQSEQPQMFWGMTENTYCMLMHLSQLLNFSGAGIVVPIILWAVNKDQSPTIDLHGKNILNFIISVFIYVMVSVVLMFVVIGFLILPVFAVLMIVFPIIAGIKANNGEYWKYPLCIRFFK